MAYLRGKYGPYPGFDVGDLARKRYSEALVKKAGLWPGDRALDVVCGHGTVGNGIARAFTKCRVAAVEPEPTELAIARKNAEIEDCAKRLDFTQADPTALPFDDETFMLATCALALSDHPDPLEVIAEIHRVTAFYGKVLLVDVDFSNAATRPRALKKHVLGQDTQEAMREMGYGKMQTQRLDVLRGGAAIVLLAAKRFDPEGGAEEAEDDETEDAT